MSAQVFWSGGAMPDTLPAAGSAPVLSEARLPTAGPLGSVVPPRTKNAPPFGASSAALKSYWPSSGQPLKSVVFFVSYMQLTACLTIVSPISIDPARAGSRDAAPVSASRE